MNLVDIKIFFESKILSKNEIAKNILLIKIAKPSDFSFIAGQFIQCLIPETKTHVLRAFSISSAPYEKNIELCIKVLPEGKASTFFTNVKEGKNLQFKGPFGNFVSKNDFDFVGIATGTGIAPIISIIKNKLFIEKTNKKIHLLFGLRYIEDVFYIENLRKWQEQYPNFSFEITISRPHKNFSGTRGRVTDHLPNIIYGSEKEYFICGNIEMVKDTKKILENKNVNSKDIHFEIY